jgi:hypothetical protein
MIIRILGALFGGLIFWIAFSVDDFFREEGLMPYVMVLMGSVFLLYGIGGQRTLSKILPFLTSNPFVKKK